MYGLTKIPQPRFNLLGDVDSVFAGFFPPHGADAPALDIVETGDGYEVAVDLPGVRKEDLAVSVKDNVLTIEAETRDERADASVITSERRTGKHRRALRLGKAVDESKIRAAYRDGVLKLTLPRAAEVAGRTVEVEAH
ncbi:MAG: Hsp20 family protein [Gammaproteobacteria bacterium]|nr:Hsp20 family protein [Gammaproteobacteria bacterium]MDA7995389.1 Hsp20 family protein [Gammaproteobacteria bacterium]